MIHRLYILRAGRWQFWAGGPPGFIERERSYLVDMVGHTCRVDMT
jgi:hypothetical protein